MAPTILQNLSNELSTIAEKLGPAVVAVHGRHRMPSSGIQWRKGVIVTANHAIRGDDAVTISTGAGQISATLAGRDPSTDIAALKLAGDTQLAVPDFADVSGLKLANIALALGRSWRGNLVASAGIVGGLSGEWRTWRGGRLDQHIRLALDLYPGFSGGPLVSAEGKVIGMNTRGIARGRAVTIPAPTINRVVDELLEKGHIASPYLGLAMQAVAIPESLRAKLKSELNNGLVVLHVESNGPAAKAGIILGDTVVSYQGKGIQNMETIREALVSSKVGDVVPVTVLRGGVPLELSVTLADRPAQ